jgi:hypothetical protein
MGAITSSTAGRQAKAPNGSKRPQSSGVASTKEAS